MRLQALAVLAGAVASLALLACAGPPGSAPGHVGGETGPTMLQVATYESCPWRFGEAGLQVIQTRAAWEPFLAQARPSPGTVSDWAPRFGPQWVVVYRAGLKRSGGHGLKLGSPVLADGGRAVQLPVTQVSPHPGSLQAMVMTSPCAVGWLQAPPASSLRVVDAQTGALLAETALGR